MSRFGLTIGQASRASCLAGTDQKIVDLSFVVHVLEVLTHCDFEFFLKDVPVQMLFDIVRIVDDRGCSSAAHEDDVLLADLNHV